jgi:pseudaminic acid synthase
MKIAGREISQNYPPYIIAEMSNNHLRDLDKAKKIIEIAAECGADAIKIQTYTADSLTIDCQRPDFVIQDPLWRGKTYYQLYQEIAMPLEWTGLLFEHAHQVGITIFSSPFDEQAVDLLESLGAPAYKIASFEANDISLVSRVLATGRPMIISTGVSTFAELEDLFRTLSLPKDNTALLHCVSEYPARTADFNLTALGRLKQLGVQVGLSDHSLSHLAAIGSVMLGATLIEKHFTLDRGDGGPDADFSLEPPELRQLVINAKDAWEALGNNSVLDQPKRKGHQHARSIYAVSDIAEGEQFNRKNIRVIRPGFGLQPALLPEILGRTARVALERGTAIQWLHIAE